ncbi:hypothetical protein AVEN_77360-1 [Araneus ventricosus]|uniref:Uncharacterized protein n=1 Tax=Araneus ventricosus TaxID=182803 RepID=A0A4Y2C8R1_ARAVE|nr:hypothetical protein AVEN_77360-1 [Araneus ventricosus]
MFHGYVENKETKEFRWDREEKTDDPSHEQNGFLMKPKQKKTPVSTGKGKEERKNLSSYTLRQINHFSNATPPLQIKPSSAMQLPSTYQTNDTSCTRFLLLTNVLKRCLRYQAGLKGG